MRPLEEIEKAFKEIKDDPAFREEYQKLLAEYSGRPTALTYADRVTEHLGGAKIYLKREDLNHTGSHKINNALGQALLAQKMGKTKIIAETGAGQRRGSRRDSCRSLVFPALYLWVRRMSPASL